MHPGHQVEQEWSEDAKMDCCKDRNEKECCNDLKKKNFFGNRIFSSKELKKKLNGGNRKMNTRITLWIVIGVLFVTTLFLTFKVGAGSVGTVQAVTGAAASAASSGGMVGGC